MDRISGAGSEWGHYPSYTLSSKHPYENSADLVFEASVPGAEQISLYFSKFDLESNYDFVELYDSTGALVEKLSGKNDDSFSSAIKGNYVKIVLKSDKSVNKYGFDITKIAYKNAAALAIK